MFFVILMLILFVISLIGFISDSDYAPALAFSIVFLIASFIIPITGIFDYPNLIGKKEEIIALKSEIENVRSCYYQNKNINTMVGGSIENMQQSQKLSEYVIQYAEKKAKYNSCLSETKTAMGMNIFWWIGSNALRTKKILDLEIIN